MYWRMPCWGVKARCTSLCVVAYRCDRGFSPFTVSALWSLGVNSSLDSWSLILFQSDWIELDTKNHQVPGILPAVFPIVRVVVLNKLFSSLLCSRNPVHGRSPGHMAVTDAPSDTVINGNTTESSLSPFQRWNKGRNRQKVLRLQILIELNLISQLRWLGVLGSRMDPTLGPCGVCSSPGNDAFPSGWSLSSPEDVIKCHNVHVSHLPGIA